MEFTAAVLRDGSKAMQFETVRLADLRDDEVLVRLTATGICHSDLAMRDGVVPVPRPIILGHEGAGIVERTGAAVDGLAAGDPVVLTFGACGHCRSCSDTEPAYCHEFAAFNFSGRRADGSTALAGTDGPIGGHFFRQSSFAAYAVANASNAVKVRADAPLELLGPFGCGFQTGAGAVLNSLGARPGDTLAILGGGGVGLSAVMAGVLAGCERIVLSEPNAERRVVAREVGATDVIDPFACGDLAPALVAAAGRPLDMIVDTSGLPVVIESAFNALAPRGRLGLVAMQNFAATLTVPLASIVGGGKVVRGIVEGSSVPRAFIPYLVDRFMEGRFPIDKLCRFYPFAELETALHDQETGRTIKPIVRFERS